MFRRVTQKLTKSGGLLLAVTLAAVVGGATTAIVTAAIPSSNGTISACYGKINGNLRVIDAESGKTCNGLENPLSWSSSGGNTQTISNAMTVPVNGSGDQVLLNVPGYGELVVEADTCTDSSILQVHFVNTTSSVEQFGLGSTTYNSALNPGQSTPALSNYTNPLQVEVGGNASRLTTISVSEGNELDSTNTNFLGCNIFAQSVTAE